MSKPPRHSTPMANAKTKAVEAFKQKLIKKLEEDMIEYKRNHTINKRNAMSKEWTAQGAINAIIENVEAHVFERAKSIMLKYAKQEKIKLLERCKIYLKHPDKNIEGYSYSKIEEELKTLKDG